MTAFELWGKLHCIKQELATRLEAVDAAGAGLLKRAAIIAIVKGKQQDIYTIKRPITDAAEACPVRDLSVSAAYLRDTDAETIQQDLLAWLRFA